ncbi:XRE family transcriptional regulator [Actinomadura sp. KC06]|uniref:helix-turn-helix domain-containing protein n=1 Tax=Actinomadura sp. KC06 TaxID=2530369 RepID=UPI00104762D8|nr:helix-turn-helix transcriptional regulator [Actinomadura sp. KC06]TDD37812.1 XRE family transcriptional regulator [Actinomadura sp. KC06]
MPTDRPPIGLKIKRARERQKPRMTQEQLADKIGVSQKTIDNWENDRSYPRSSIGALEEILGPLTDGAPPPAFDGTPYPDWAVGDRFLEHILDYAGPEVSDDEKIFAARAVLTYRDSQSGQYRASEQKQA